MFPPTARFARDASGAVAPLFAIGLVAFIGVGALAWDVGRGYALRSELEAAVDAAALAGATQLDGKPDAITRATAAAQGALVQNSNRLGDAFQANTVGAGDTIQFLTNLTDIRAGTPDDEDSGTALTVVDSKAKFIEITLAPRPMGLVMGAILGISGFNARAHAVAGYGSAICKIPPLFVCNPNEDETIDLFGAHAGKGITMNGRGGGAHFAPGNFGFLQVGGNLSALQDALGRSPPLTECYGNTVETRTGDPTSVLDYYNMRFDIFANNQLQKAAYTASPYYAPGAVSVTGLNRHSGAGTNICRPGVTGSTYNGTYSSGIQAMALPRDTCAYASGGSTCVSGAAALGTGNWDRSSYFRVTHNYTGTISPTTTPLTNEQWADFYDYPSASTKPTYPTRYQVYLWEKENISNPLLFRQSSGLVAANTKTTQTGDWHTRQCSTATPVAGVPDRRTISALILNCSLIQNNTPQNVMGAVDLFLTEPAATNGNGTIYGEVISSTSDTSEVGKETMFYSVRLYE